MLTEHVAGEGRSPPVAEFEAAGGTAAAARAEAAVPVLLSSMKNGLSKWPVRQFLQRT